MQKNANPLGQANFNNVLTERQDAASQFIGAQEVSAKWTMLPGSRPVPLAELRGNMCRWPIGDPQHFDAFRYCGCRRQLGDTYCDAHKKMAFVPSKARVTPIAEGSPARPAIHDRSKSASPND